MMVRHIGGVFFGALGPLILNDLLEIHASIIPAS